jgi:hypothetical protein
MNKFIAMAILLAVALVFIAPQIDLEPTILRLEKIVCCLCFCFIIFLLSWSTLTTQPKTTLLAILMHLGARTAAWAETGTVEMQRLRC